MKFDSVSSYFCHLRSIINISISILIIMFWFRQEVCGSLSGGFKKKAAYPECCSAECPGYLLCRLLSTRTAVYICRRTAVYNTTSKHQTQHNKRIFSNSSALLNVSPPIISYSVQPKPGCTSRCAMGRQTTISQHFTRTGTRS